MHILLTDVLTCARCGPGFGLILLADRLEARRIREGSLGCANCRERYPIRGGTADLRPRTGDGARLAAGADEGGQAGESQPARTAAPEPGAPAANGDERAAEPPPDEAALRLAALLDLTGGDGVVLLAGRCAGLAEGLAEHVPHGEVAAAVGEDRVVGSPAASGVSRLVLPPARLPFASRSLKAIALHGHEAAHLLEEAARALAPMGRLVLEEGPPDAGARLRTAGLEVLVTEGDSVVALKRDRPDPPKLYQLA